MKSILLRSRMYLPLALLLVSARLNVLPARGSPIPIGLSGFNADIVTDANVGTRFAMPADIGTADWFESGAVDGGGIQHNDGLIAGNLASAFTNSVTGGHTAFQFQPFNSNNALLLRYPNSNSGTLALTVPGKYANLAILAAGYNAAANETGTVVINFADASQSAPLNYNAFDWGFGASNIAVGSLGRNFDNGTGGTAFNYNRPTSFGLYETDLDLTAIGLNDKTIVSLTFIGGTVSDQPGTMNHGPNTSILAVSGTAVPEPSSWALAVCGIAVLAFRRIAQRLPRSGVTSLWCRRLACTSAQADPQICDKLLSKPQGSKVQASRLHHNTSQ